MAEQMTYWVCADGMQFDDEQDAVNHELIMGVASLLDDVAKQHQIDNIEYEALVPMAELLIMTDALAQLKSLLKDKGF